MEALRSILRDILPRRLWTGPKIEKLAQQLFFIGNGMKTGFIWDIGSFDPESANRLLNSLKSAYLVDDALTVFKIGDDFGFFIVKAVRTLKYDRFSFIDVSKCLCAPSVITKSSKESLVIQKCLDELRQQLSLVKPNEILSINLDLDLTCFPTVFGLLIGYPVVYWYDRSESDENCLAGLELDVFQVGLVNSSREKTCFGDPTISFSIPSCVALDEAVRVRLETWRKTIPDLGFEIIHFVKSLDNVIL